MRDVLVAGGGVIGLSVAWELARQGVQVTVLERAQPGREASWAGAGMLPPGNTTRAHSAEQQLRSQSHLLWPKWSAELREQTGVDNGYRVTGGLHVVFPEDLSRLKLERQQWHDEQIPLTDHSAESLRAVEPALSDLLAGGFELPEQAQVRNPRHLKALLVACSQAGVRIECGSPVVQIDQSGGRFRQLRTPSGTYQADACVLAAGPWTGPLFSLIPSLADSPACRAVLGIRPVRGQIVLLNTQLLPFRRMIEYGKRYLVPRPDGRVLVGSTEEDAGFDRSTTSVAIAELIQFAGTLVPALKQAAVEQCWSGLRPVSPDTFPLLGPVPGCDGLFLAAGHGRSGLQMSPVTGVLLRQIMLGQAPCLPPELVACTEDRQPASREGC